MVVSKLESSVYYPEPKGLYANDNERESELYKMVVKGVDVLCAIGLAREQNDLFFFPIYLVKRDRKVVQVGLYEIRSGDSKAHDDLIRQMPLLFAFVNKQFLLDNRMEPSEFQDIHPQAKDAVE